MANVFFFFKVLYVVGFVFWFVGLFYLGCIFVYDEEVFGKVELECSMFK